MFRPNDPLLVSTTSTRKPWHRQPGLVIAAWVFSYWYAVFMVAITVAVCADYLGEWPVIAVVAGTVVVGCVFIWAGGMAMLGKSRKPLAFVALSWAAVNVALSFYAAFTGGNLLRSGLLGFVIPLGIFLLISSRSSRDYFVHQSTLPIEAEG